MPEPKFPLGQIVATPGALADLEEANERPETYLKRHQAGDWGECCPGDVEINEDGLKWGERLMSVYTLSSGKTLWLITEADRSVSTFLRPEDY